MGLFDKITKKFGVKDKKSVDGKTSLDEDEWYRENLEKGIKFFKKKEYYEAYAVLNELHRKYPDDTIVQDWLRKVTNAQNKKIEKVQGKPHIIRRQSRLTAQRLYIFIANEKLSQRQIEALSSGHQLSGHPLIDLIVPETMITTDVKDILPFTIGVLANLRNTYPDFTYDVKELEYSSFFNPHTNHKGWMMILPFTGSLSAGIISQETRSSHPHNYVSDSLIEDAEEEYSGDFQRQLQRENQQRKQKDFDSLYSLNRNTWEREQEAARRRKETEQMGEK